MRFNKSKISVELMDVMVHYLISRNKTLYNTNLKPIQIIYKTVETQSGISYTLKHARYSP